MLTENIETWTGEDAEDFRKTAIVKLGWHRRMTAICVTAGVTSSVDDDA